MRKLTSSCMGVLTILYVSALTVAQSPEPPTNLVVADTPNDAGKSIDVNWTLSPSDIFAESAFDTAIPDPEFIVASYHIERKTVASTDSAIISDENKQWRQVSESAAGEATFTDRTVLLGWSYEYRVNAVDNQGNQSTWAIATGSVAPSMQWFNGSKAWLAIFMFVFCGLVVFFVNAARSGKKLWVREIAGLSAIDEAVGRATEMGRPVLFVLGIQDINEIQTLAGLTVLSRVARTAAEYGAQIEVPTCRSLVMAAARETVEASYLAAGRPDSYQPDRIHYLTDEQFAFVAGVTGYMVREKPAACIYMGGFYAESLILAETGNYIGAIQVAGTAMPSQLPFFVASCDYTLIGEEFFAASAYLSGDPLQIGSLKGQDWGKFVAVLVLIIGIFFATVYSISSLSHLSEIDSVVRNALIDESYSGPTQSEIEENLVAQLSSALNLEVALNSKLPLELTSEHELLTEEDISILIDLRKFFSVSKVNSDTISISSIQHLADALFYVSQSDDYRFFHNPNTLNLLHSVSIKLQQKYPDVASEINSVCSNYRLFDSLNGFVYSLSLLTDQTDDSVVALSLNYMRNNMLGKEGLGSLQWFYNWFQDGGDTEIEGEVS